MILLASIPQPSGSSWGQNNLGEISSVILVKMYDVCTSATKETLCAQIMVNDLREPLSHG
jgi:hypothetical protein